MESMQNWLYLLLPVVAFIYASVGHGGASSYLMLLVLFGFTPEEVRPTALIMNMCVSAIAFLMYRRVIIFPSRLFWILIAFSVPAAYLGGTIKIDSTVYKQILGGILVLIALNFFNLFPVSGKTNIRPFFAVLALCGVVIGFLSGLIGIGGGIILSPLVLMLGWAGAKETASLSAIFIFINSLSGFFGMKGWQISYNSELMIFLPLAVLGGLLGAYSGAFKWNAKIIKYVLGVVLIVAGSKLLMG
jgi:uncharacterized membrane protein YfcA